MLKTEVKPGALCIPIRSLESCRLWPITQKRPWLLRGAMHSEPGYKCTPEGQKHSIYYMEWPGADPTAHSLWGLFFSGWHALYKYRCVFLHVCPMYVYPSGKSCLCIGHMKSVMNFIARKPPKGRVVSCKKKKGGGGDRFLLKKSSLPHCKCGVS